MTYARGKSLLREAEQDARKEDTNTEAGAADTGLACHDQAQMSLTPFGATPGPTMGLLTEEPGDPKEMDLD